MAQKNKSNLSKRGRMVIPANKPKAQPSFVAVLNNVQARVIKGEYWMQVRQGVYNRMGYGPQDLAAVRSYNRIGD